MILLQTDIPKEKLSILHHVLVDENEKEVIDHFATGKYFVKYNYCRYRKKDCTGGLKIHIQEVLITTENCERRNVRKCSCWYSSKKNFEHQQLHQ